MSSLIKNSSSSYYQFQQSLDQYVYFSPLTMGGASGRAVKIHKDLFLPFFCVVDPTTHDGQSIIRQIENLRTTCTIVRQQANGGNANTQKQKADHRRELEKLNDAFQQVLIIKNLHIHYRVSQESGDGDKAPSIYISSFRLVNANSQTSPGLYEMNMYQKAVEKKIWTADGHQIFLNGSTSDIYKAFDDAKRITDQTKPLVFFSNATVNDELGFFSSGHKSKLTQHTIAKLKDVLINNLAPSQGIKWYAEGAGIGLLAETIKLVKDDLPKHEFYLVNPTSNSQTLVKTLHAKKAKCEALAIESKSDCSQIGMGFNTLRVNNLPRLAADLKTYQIQQKDSKKTFVQLIKAAGNFRK